MENQSSSWHKLSWPRHHHLHYILQINCNTAMAFSVQNQLHLSFLFVLCEEKITTRTVAVKDTGERSLLNWILEIRYSKPIRFSKTWSKFSISNLWRTLNPTCGRASSDEAHFESDREGGKMYFDRILDRQGVPFSMSQ